MERQPALDGVRAVAVAMVLLFHGGVSWMHGGYFGVSVFFTLSGFLITSLLVREHTSTGRIATGAFYARRARRLLPASTLCLAIVSIMAARDSWRGANHVARDVLGGLFQVANWVQLAGGGSYTDLQSKAAGLRSPLDHYWSLAIEEQFYWLWPLCFWALARTAQRRGWSLTRIFVPLLLVFAAAAPIIAVIWGRDAAYWATPARAAEILIGALLAVALREGRVVARAWMAPSALIVVLVLAVALPAGGGPAYHGAFPLLAVASATLLLGLQRPGPVTRALSWKPLVGLGAISYGVYLFHFPVYVFLSADRVGIDGVGLLLLRLAVTLVIALTSYWLVEQPIRRAHWTAPRTLVHAVVAAAIVCLAVAFVPSRDARYWTASAASIAAAEIPTGEPVGALVVATTAPDTTSTDGGHTTDLPGTTESEATTEATTSTTPTPTPTPTPTSTSSTTPSGSTTSSGPTTSAAPTTSDEVVVPGLPLVNRPVRILVLGDSTAEAAASGLVQWSVDNPTIARVSVLASPGCGFLRGAISGDDDEYTAVCEQIIDTELPEQLAALQPDVVMLMTTRDYSPRTFVAAEGAVAATTDEFLAELTTSYRRLEELILFSSTAHVAWVRPPQVNPYWQSQDIPVRDPDARRAVDAAVAQVAAAHPDRAAVIDLRSWFEQQGLDANRDYRPDGLHLNPVAALDVAERFLIPELLAEATRAG